MKNALFIILVFSTLTVTAQSNFALSLNGTNNDVTINTPLSSGSSYTKEAWVYQAASAGAQNIISSMNSPFWINAGILSAGQAGSFSLVTDPTTFPLNRWVHVAVTYDNATTTMKLYRDGILISTNNAVPAYTSESTFIGSHQGSTSFFQGNIDEVRIWNTALTQTQLKQNIYGGPANNASGLVAYYKCNAGAGSVLASSCTNTSGLDGTLQNSPAWVASPVQLAGNALNFDGADDFVIIPNVVSSDFTIEYWMKTTSTGPGSAATQWYGGNGIVDAEVGGVGNDWGTSLVANKLAFGIGNPDVTIKSTSAVNTGSWVHVAASWKQSSGQMILYINGILEAANTGGTALRSAPPRITFGEIQTNIQRFNGSIDEVRIWNEVRTQAQILANINKELDPSAAVNLGAYYTFDQGIASGTNTGLTTLMDQKGINNGTLTNFAVSGATSNFVTQNNTLFVLPLEWLGFTVQKEGSHALLEWSTSHEQNTRNFIIQHSTNSSDWNNIDVIAAIGNINAVTNYSYTHTNPVNGINYYRIMQTDIDGRSSYSDVKSVRFNISISSFSILNNPVIDGSLQVKLDKPAILSLYNSEGKLLWQEQVNAETRVIDVKTYAKGMYLLKTNNQTEKIIIR